MSKGRVERNPSALRASNKDRRRAVRDGVNHRHQVRDRRKRLPFRAVSPKPRRSTRSPDYSRRRFQLRLPHAAVGDAGVKKDDRIAADYVFRSQRGAAGRNPMIGNHDEVPWSVPDGHTTSKSSIQLA